LVVYPPWRAFLTWAALAQATGWTVDFYTMQSLVDSAISYFDKVNGAFHSPLPSRIWIIPLLATITLSTCWFEPLVLRLDLLRSFAWLGLPNRPNHAVILLGQGRNIFMWSLFVVAASALSVLVLRGCRSRPWISMIGATLMAGVAYYFERFGFRILVWLTKPELTLPYAVALLYGTRLLRPEERVQNEE